VPAPWRPTPEGGPDGAPWQGPSAIGEAAGPDGEVRVRAWLRLKGGRVAECAVWADPAWFTPEEARLVGAMVELRRAAPPLLVPDEVVRDLSVPPPAAEAATAAVAAALEDWGSRYGGLSGRARALSEDVRGALRDNRGEVSYRGYKLR